MFLLAFLIVVVAVMSALAYLSHLTDTGRYALTPRPSAHLKRLTDVDPYTRRVYE